MPKVKSDFGLRSPNFRLPSPDFRPFPIFASMTYIKSNELFAGMEFEKLYDRIPRPIVIADNLRNPDNAGALVRLSDNLGAAELLFLAEKDSQFLPKMQKVAASSFGNLHWRFENTSTIPEEIMSERVIVALETSANASNLYETELPHKPAFIVGNERNGIRKEILAQAAMIVYIPVPGMTRSLNVTHAAAVLFFEWYRQMAARFR
ncbi:MAG: TrmH family RNA methyltransferase [Bacteroidales bacterium]